MRRDPALAAAGFTLVELLVVIGIISILISILLPSLSRARGAAQSVACLANLRSIGQALAIYQAENKASMPPLSQKAKNGAFDNNNFQGFNLWGLLKVKAGTSGVVCPTALQMEQPTWGAAANSARAKYSYKYNWFVAGAETNPGVAPHLPHARVIDTATNTIVGSPMKNIRNASETLAFICHPQVVAFQTNDLPGSDRGMKWASVKPGTAQIVNGAKRQAIRSVAPMHGMLKPNPKASALSDGSPAMMGMTNVLYCDGSARSVPVRQGEFVATADPASQVVLNDTTGGGNIRAGNLCVLEGTRLDPTMSP